MESLKSVGAALPEAALDIKLNLQAVLQESSLSGRQRWGVALASAIATRNPALREAVLQDGDEHLDEATLDDARAAAVLMAMNNVFYRFRHVVGNPAYQELPPRLRMNRIASPKTSKVDFELFCLAVSAINNCEACVRSHERAVIAGGISVQQVHDAIRIAATLAPPRSPSRLPPTRLASSRGTWWGTSADCLRSKPPTSAYVRLTHPTPQGERLALRSADRILLHLQVRARPGSCKRWRHASEQGIVSNREEVPCPS